MTDAVRERLGRALALSKRERAAIASALLQSLDDTPPPSPEEQAEIEAAWSGEIRRRVAAYAAGAAELIDGEQVLADLRAGRRAAGRS